MRKPNDENGHCYISKTNSTIQLDNPEKMWPRVFRGDQDTYVVALISIDIDRASTYHFYKAIPAEKSSNPSGPDSTIYFGRDIILDSSQFNFNFFNKKINTVAVDYSGKEPKRTFYGPREEYTYLTFDGVAEGHAVACAQNTPSPYTFFLNIVKDSNNNQVIEISIFDKTNSANIKKYQVSMPDLNQMKNTHAGTKATRTFDAILEAEVIFNEVQKKAYIIYGHIFKNHTSDSSVFISFLSLSEKTLFSNSSFSIQCPIIIITLI